jgi:hypothetical protein
VALVFGLSGFLLSRSGWPRVPLVMGLVLGSLFETNLLLTIRLQQLGRVELWNRPIALALLALAAFSLVTAIRGLGRSWGAARVQHETGSSRRAGERLACTAVLIILAGTFAWLTVGLGPVARRVPAIVVTALMVLLAAQFVFDWRALRAHSGRAGEQS